MTDHSAADGAAMRDRSAEPCLRTGFGPLTVSYHPSVLAPRAWTLMQSTWAAELAHHAGAGPILELCAGAGHIGLAAAVLADRDLVQIEIDAVAAEYCRRNAFHAGRSERSKVRVLPLEDALEPGETFPILIADPPYLPSDQVDRWPEDPRTAIDGGVDGMRVIDQCLLVAAEHVEADGVVLLQTAGAGQAAAVAERAAALTADRLVAVETREVDAERAVLRMRHR